MSTRVGGFVCLFARVLIPVFPLHKPCRADQRNNHLPRSHLTGHYGLIINNRDGGGGGGLQNGKIGGLKLFAPPSSQGKTFCAPLPLKSGNVLCLPFNMAKTSSYRAKNIPKLCVPPPSFSMAKTLSAPHVRRRKT